MKTVVLKGAMFARNLLAVRLLSPHQHHTHPVAALMGLKECLEEVSIPIIIAFYAICAYLIHLIFYLWLSRLSFSIPLRVSFFFLFSVYRLYKYRLLLALSLSLSLCLSPPPSLYFLSLIGICRCLRIDVCLIYLCFKHTFPGYIKQKMALCLNNCTQRLPK